MDKGSVSQIPSKKKLNFLQTQCKRLWRNKLQAPLDSLYHLSREL